MMKLDRRMLLGGGAAVLIAGGGLYAWQSGLIHRDTTPLSTAAGTQAQATKVDLTTLGEAVPLGDRVLGSADAKVTIIEYASATCPHCGHFHETTFPTLKSEYIDTGKVRFIFREFPFDDLALAAFMIARCAPEDRYYPMIDVLYAQQKDWVQSKDPRGALFKIAQMAGFTQQSFDDCLKNEKIAQGILDGKTKAESTYGIESTPTFFINGKALLGAQPIEEFRKMIDAALAG